MSDKRALPACDSCHKRKIKCDRVQPRCNWCMHHDITCSSTRKRSSGKSGNRAKKLKFENFDERLERLERVLKREFGNRNHSSSERSELVLRAALLNKAGAPSSSAGDIDSVVSVALSTLKRNHRSEYLLGGINLLQSIWFLSPEGRKKLIFENHEHQSVNGKALSQIGQQASPGSFVLQQVAPCEATQLPAKETTLKVLDFYYASVFARAFPIADPILFPITVEKAYEEKTSTSTDSLGAVACIYSFLAFTSIIDDDSEIKLPAAVVDAYVAAAQLAMTNVLNAWPSTEMIDALMMLAVYQFCGGNFDSADIILSIATRCLFALGAHQYPEQDVEHGLSTSQSIEDRTILHRRDMFWICYKLDQDITSRTGRPPIIHDPSCDITLPRDYLKKTTTRFARVTRLAGDLRLSLIKSKAYAGLYSPSAMRKTDAELLKSIRELDDLLETWRLSQPLESRPILSFTQDAHNTVSDLSSFDVSAFLVRLEYYHCMMTIHQASSRCQNWSESSIVDEALRSSLDIALESSRSCLLYLHSHGRFFIPNLFWIVIFYPVSAALTLFCHIILNPRNPVALSDLKILIDVSKTIPLLENVEHGPSDSRLESLSALRQFVQQSVDQARSLVLDRQ